MSDSIQIFPFWDKITDEQRDMLLRNTKTIRFAKGENIHNGNSSCLGVLLIKKGRIRAYILSEDGREVTLYRLGEGEVCVLSSASCVLSQITFDVFIDAEEDTEAEVISPSAFSKTAESNIYVENFALKIAMERFSDVMWAMQQILFMGLDKRLAVFLVDETVKQKSPSVRMTHEQIARNIGSAREAVTRMLKGFAEEGMVALSRGEIRVTDKDKLRALCGI